jgi:hypothetical protein
MGAAVRHTIRGSCLASVALAVAVVGALPGVAHAIRCTKPDDLCTGDPCVVRQVEVSSPCELDFSATARWGSAAR